MLALEDEFPEIYKHVKAGNFAAQLTGGKSFSRCETDKVIEMTLNKDSKTPGGTTGFSTSVGAVKRWEINSSYRASLRKCFHEHLQYETQNYIHKDLTPSRIAKDEKDIQSVLNVLTEMFIPPFSDQPQLSMSTGTVVPDSVADRILSAKYIGESAMKSFIDTKLSEEATLSFFDQIKKNNQHSPV